MKILVTPTSLQKDSHSDALKKLREYTDDIVFNEYKRPLSEDELIPLLKECDGYIAGLDMITKKVIDSCDRLKVISRYGAGYDRVDIEAAKEKGVIVTNTPGANAEAVGELAMALILSIARKIPELNYSTKQGEWKRANGIELKGKKIGIVGMGSVGRVVARCAQGFGMHVIAHDPYIDFDYCQHHDIEVCGFEMLLKEADVISLHLPLTEQTKHIIDKNAIAKMKPSSIIINTSRGGIIDEEAAYEALKNRKIGGLGLDAFETEPPKKSLLFEFENVVATPHTGAHTNEAVANMANMAVNNLIDILEKGKSRFTVT